MKLIRLEDFSKTKLIYFGWNFKVAGIGFGAANSMFVYRLWCSDAGLLWTIPLYHPTTNLNISFTKHKPEFIIRADVPVCSTLQFPILTFLYLAQMFSKASCAKMLSCLFVQGSVFFSPFLWGFVALRLRWESQAPQTQTGQRWFQRDYTRSVSRQDGLIPDTPPATHTHAQTHSHIRPPPAPSFFTS